MKDKLIAENKFPVKHFTSVKSRGNMKDGVQRNSFLRSLGLEPENLVLARQIHSADARIVCEFDRGGFVENCDGLITGAQNTMLGIFTADCMPVLMASKDKSVKAAVHAGWKGLAAGILQNSINIFNEKFGVKAEDIIVYIGPHIMECCYEVSNDMEKTFNVKLNNGKLNLSGIAVKILEKAGVKNIYASDLCSFCREDLFFSYRRDKSEERMITVL
ncbi:MAG: peptidoglycan editing factor PgeF [Endomicrobia bacterium]|nr:peptidoglycan editing factor PgeF [Endomicrobiia bacterium]